MGLRPEPDEALSAYYEYFAGILTGAVDLGVRFFDEWLPPALSGAEWEIAPLQIYRSLLERFDGMAILAKQSGAEALLVVLRTVFEGFLGLEYMLKDKRTERAMAYLYHLNVNFDSLLDSAKLPRPDPLSDSYDPIATEWNRVQKLRGIGRFPNWFSMFPSEEGKENKNVKELAEYLGFKSLYDVIYDLGSKVIHYKYNDLVADSGDGHTLFVRLRNPEHLQRFVAYAVYLCYESTRLVVKTYAPERAMLLETLFAQTVKPGLVILNGPSLITVIDTLPPEE